MDPVLNWIDIGFLWMFSGLIWFMDAFQIAFQILAISPLICFELSQEKNQKNKWALKIFVTWAMAGTAKLWPTVHSKNNFLKLLSRLGQVWCGKHQLRGWESFSEHRKVCFGALFAAWHSWSHCRAAGFRGQWLWPKPPQSFTSGTYYHWLRNTDIEHFTILCAVIP